MYTLALNNVNLWNCNKWNNTEYRTLHNQEFYFLCFAQSTVFLERLGKTLARNMAHEEKNLCINEYRTDVDQL
jgi:hypothetical protein